MHVFFDTVWKLHIGEIPEKPDPKNYLYPGPLVSDLKQYEHAIAAIKQNALTVGNSELIEKIIPVPIGMSYKKDHFYPLPNGWDNVEILEKNPPVAILTLPEEKKSEEFDRFLPCAPKQKDTFGQRQRLKDKLQKLKAAEEKKNTMENMAKEPEPREVLFKYPQLRHLEIKVGSLEMSAIECAMREYAIEFQKFSLYKDHPTTASGSVAAPKEEEKKEEYKVSFEITLPAIEATEKDVIDWLKYHLGITSELKGTNPLVEIELSDSEIDYLSVQK